MRVDRISNCCKFHLLLLTWIFTNLFFGYSVFLFNGFLKWTNKYIEKSNFCLHLIFNNWAEWPRLAVFFNLQDLKLFWLIWDWLTWIKKKSRRRRRRNCEISMELKFSCIAGTLLPRLLQIPFFYPEPASYQPFTSTWSHHRVALDIHLPVTHLLYKSEARWPDKRGGERRKTPQHFMDAGDVPGIPFDGGQLKCPVWVLWPGVRMMERRDSLTSQAVVFPHQSRKLPRLQFLTVGVFYGVVIGSLMNPKP